jgi:monothiol glutaredoxin
MALEIQDIISNQIKQDNIVLYIKGTKQQPMCGYSATVLTIINQYKKPFMCYNVLDDEALRQGIKTFSQWPTIPQLYINQTFVGGCDIITDLHQKDKLKDYFDQKQEA